MRYAVIGTGYWGSNHARVAAELADEGVIDDVIFCDRDEERVKAEASTYGVEWTTDYRNLPELGTQAAVVATPSKTHRKIAVFLCRAGIDVLVEKPLAPTSEAAWAIDQEAKENDVTLAVGHIFRHHPALSALQERIERGELGDVQYAHTVRYSYREGTPETGILYRQAVHDVDIYQWLFGGPSTIYCQRDGKLPDETATIVTKHGDMTGVINESWRIPVFGKRRDLVVVGSERAAHVDYLDNDTITLYDVRRGRERGQRTVTVEGSEPLKAEVVDFIDAIETPRPPEATGRIGAEAIETIELADKSARISNAVQ